MSELNPLNDLSRIYLDKVALMNRQEEQNDVERWQGILDDQMEKSSKKLATLGAPTMEEEKKAAKDYDGDGKIESGKDEYFGSKDKAIKKAMKKEDTHNYVEAYVTELKKTTLGSYVKKASKDLANRSFDHGESEKRQYDPDEADAKEAKKQSTRQKGIDRAADKLAKEELELDEAERKLADRLARKRKLYDKTTRKAMDDARRTGEASGHNRFRMGSLDREMDGIKAKMNKESAEHRRNPEGSVKDRFKSRQTDPSKDNFTGIGDDIGEIMRQNAAMKKAAAKKKVKEGRFSDWRNDLSDLIEVAPMTDVEAEKEVTEKKVNNKVVINPKMSEAVAQIGGQVLSETEVDLQEKKDKDTPDQVKAVIAYDRARHATDDATYDTMHGKKKQAKKERDYAKWQRDTGARDAQKSGHPWEHEKYGTREKEGKKSVKHAHVKDSYDPQTEVVESKMRKYKYSDKFYDAIKKDDKETPKITPTARARKGVSEGYGKKKKHDCASKVKHEEFGIGNCIKGMHTIDENNMVTHYDVEFKEYIVENCPVEELEILVSEMHSHATMKEGVVSKEVKALQKAGKTLKDTPVVNADKIDTPNYKGQKFGVKEDDDWIQKAVKRPGAFTRKAKAAGQSVQQFAKTVDANPGKYSTRTKRQANLAQTFASMKKEDVEELFYTLIVD